MASVAAAFAAGFDVEARGGSGAEVGSGVGTGAGGAVGAGAACLGIPVIVNLADAPALPTTVMTQLEARSHFQLIATLPAESATRCEKVPFKLGDENATDSFGARPETEPSGRKTPLQTNGFSKS